MPVGKSLNIIRVRIKALNNSRGSEELTSSCNLLLKDFSVSCFFDGDFSITKFFSSAETKSSESSSLSCLLTVTLILRMFGSMDIDFASSVSSVSFNSVLWTSWTSWTSSTGCGKRTRWFVKTIPSRGLSANALKTLRYSSVEKFSMFSTISTNNKNLSASLMKCWVSHLLALCLI